MAEDKEIRAIDLLLRPDAPEVVRRRRTSSVEVKRLSADLGAPFVLELRGLSYNQVQDLRGSQNSTLDTVLEGVTSPNLRDPQLLERYNAVTPEELVKDIFLPGELSDIARRVEALTGYRGDTLAELRKN